ncbi:YezD family protein [Chromatiaceae bacterium AAb-1]|nr:YezD family protein [Chromatiaceae bacterium AAb-1]
MTSKEQVAEALPQLLTSIEQLFGRVEFGSIELIFHHGKLVQLEKKEKLRLEKPAN